MGGDHYSWVAKYLLVVLTLLVVKMVYPKEVGHNHRGQLPVIVFKNLHENAKSNFDSTSVFDKYYLGIELRSSL